MIFETAAEIQASRLLTLQAAHKIDQGDPARVEIGMIKVVGAKMLHNTIDRAIQVFGAKGVTSDTPLERMYRTRPLRAHLRRPGRGPPRDRQPADPARVQPRERLGLRPAVGVLSPRR